MQKNYMKQKQNE